MRSIGIQRRSIRAKHVTTTAQHVHLRSRCLCNSIECCGEIDRAEEVAKISENVEDGGWLPGICHQMVEDVAMLAVAVLRRVNPRVELPRRKNDPSFFQLLHEEAWPSSGSCSITFAVRKTAIDNNDDKTQLLVLSLTQNELPLRHDLRDTPCRKGVMYIVLLQGLTLLSRSCRSLMVSHAMQVRLYQIIGTGAVHKGPFEVLHDLGMIGN